MGVDGIATPQAAIATARAAAGASANTLTAEKAEFATAWKAYNTALGKSSLGTDVAKAQAGVTNATNSVASSQASVMKSLSSVPAAYYSKSADGSISLNVSKAKADLAKAQDSVDVDLKRLHHLEQGKHTANGDLTIQQYADRHGISLTRLIELNPKFKNHANTWKPADGTEFKLPKGTTTQAYQNVLERYRGRVAERNKLEKTVTTLTATPGVGVGVLAHNSKVQLLGLAKQQLSLATAARSAASAAKQAASEVQGAATKAKTAAGDYVAAAKADTSAYASDYLREASGFQNTAQGVINLIAKAGSDYQKALALKV